MRMIATPKKPFPDYKWRWAVLTPTESLNRPSIFLGVLRVFERYDKQHPGAPEILKALKVVEEETKAPVDLVRDGNRNLVRNSGQYWKAMGLLEEAHGKILVSPFGKMVAAGKLTQVEFATTVLKTLELPNRRIASDVADWDKAKLRIRPLQLLLDILSELEREYGSEHAFIKPPELVEITIPLAGAKASVRDHAAALVQYRNGDLNIDTWPDCAPSANDRRMAREYLLFLANYGFCTMHQRGKGKSNECYALADISSEELVDLAKLKVEGVELVKAAKQIQLTKIPANVERRKVTREVTTRPYQHVFRKNILAACRSTCLVTGVNIENVLEAAHIIPVSEKGSDQVDNGLCLRSDIHELFDSGHLRLLSNGNIILSSLAAHRSNYAALPRVVKIPPFVDKNHLDWRIKYC